MRFAPLATLSTKNLRSISPAHGPFITFVLTRTLIQTLNLTQTLNRALTLTLLLLTLLPASTLAIPQPNFANSTDSTQSAFPGALLVVGGGAEQTGTDSWSHEPYQWFVDQAQQDTLIILSYDDLSGWLPDYFESLGATKAIPLSIQSHSPDEILAHLETAGGVFFKGGNQQDYLDAWLNTSVADGLRALFERGGAVGGTSAGGMILGEFISSNTLSRGPTSKENLLDPLNPYNQIHTGFAGFLPSTIIDTHYMERGRPGRLLGMMGRILLESPTFQRAGTISGAVSGDVSGAVSGDVSGAVPRDASGAVSNDAPGTMSRFSTSSTSSITPPQTLLGLGVDDQTAVMISKDGTMRVSGTGLVHLFRAGERVEQTRFGTTHQPEQLFLRDWPFHQLTHDYEINLFTGEVLHQPEQAVLLTANPETDCPANITFTDALTDPDRLHDLHQTDPPDAFWTIITDPTEDTGEIPLPENRPYHILPYQPDMASDTTLAALLFRGERLFLHLSAGSQAHTNPVEVLAGSALITETIRCSSLPLELPVHALPYFTLGEAVNLEQDPYVAYDGRMEVRSGNGLAGSFTMVPDSYADEDFLENKHTAPGWLTGELDASLALQTGSVAHLSVRDGLMLFAGVSSAEVASAGVASERAASEKVRGEAAVSGRDRVPDNDGYRDDHVPAANAPVTNASANNAPAVNASATSPPPTVLYKPAPGSTSAQSPFSPSGESTLPRNSTAVSHGTVSVLPAGETFTLQSGTSTPQVETTYLAGWNLLSQPLLQSHPDVYEIFPGLASGTFFRFDGSYKAANQARPGEGYWGVMLQDQSTGFRGVASPERTLHVTEGWNLIGSLDKPGRLLDPDQVLQEGTLFGYNGAYVEADTLQPGKGYWIYASQDGSVKIRAFKSP